MIAHGFVTRTSLIATPNGHHLTTASSPSSRQPAPNARPRCLPRRHDRVTLDSLRCRLPHDPMAKRSRGQSSLDDLTSGLLQRW